MSELKPIAVRAFKDVDKLLFETQTDYLNCEQVAAGYNGMIIDLAALRSAASERDKWRAWKPNSEDLAELHDQAMASDGSHKGSLAACVIYIKALEATLRERDAEVERAVMAEREACAEAAEEVPLAFYDTDTRRQIAAAIRARGEKGAK